jgi:hypothetical protein
MLELSPRSPRVKALSMTKPSSARRMAGARTSASGLVPNLASASDIPMTAPGTPTARWPTRLLSVGCPAASRYMLRVAASGATSR